MLGFDVLATHLQTMIKGGGITNGGTGRTNVCAIGMHGGMGHGRILIKDCRDDMV